MPFRRLSRLIRNLLHGRQADERVGQEVGGYLDLLIDEKMAAGADPRAARRLALAEVGGVEPIKEHVRDVRAGAWIEQTWRDTSHAARLLRRTPGFTAIALVTLALGTGATTAIFQLIDAIRLRSLPVSRANELVSIELPPDAMNAARGSFQTWYPSLTYPIWEGVQRHQEPFTGVFAWASETYNLATDGESRPGRVIWASGDYFRVLGVAPIVGRVFTADDDRPGCGSTGVVISEGFWEREYGRERAILGRTLALAGQPLPIIGVAPASFFGLEVGRGFDIVVPLCAEAYVRPSNARLRAGAVWWLSVVGRLKPGWSAERASAYEASISPSVFRDSLPANYPSVSVEKYLAFTLMAQPVASGISALRENYSEALNLLLGIALLVLVIACGNIANLLLAQASAREREMAIRLAIGASRGRLIRQSMIQSLLLATTGSGLGLLVARGLSQFLVAFLGTPETPLVLDLRMDWRLLGFTAGLAVLTCLIFGVAPALRATSMAPGDALKAGSRSVTAGRAHVGLRRGLVVSQVALSLVLLVTALLFGGTLRNLLTVDVGFKPDGILVARADFRRLSLPPDHVPAFKRDLIERLRAIPGVDGVAEANTVPLSGNGRRNAAWMDGSDKAHAQGVTIGAVGDGYFKTLGMPIAAGRAFDDRDNAASPRVVVINEAFARQFLDGASPVGKLLHIEATPAEPEATCEIVGLTRDAKFWGLRDESQPVLFLALAQDPRPGPAAQWLLRSTLPAESLTASVKQAMAAVSPQIAVSQQMLSDRIRQSLLRERLMAMLSAFFGLLAALLAMVGLYGVIAYMVARRRNEIGLRMALGASRRNVVSMVVREAFVLLAVGLAVGTALSAAIAQQARALLFGLTPHDPFSFAAAAAALAGVTLVATCVPAARAARVDPTIALRAD